MMLRSQVFEPGLSRILKYGYDEKIKLKSLIMAQIERWRQA